jgi:hypothetical protein
MNQIIQFTPYSTRITAREKMQSMLKQNRIITSTRDEIRAAEGGLQIIIIKQGYLL